MTHRHALFGLVLILLVVSCGESADSEDGAGDDGDSGMVGECPDIAPRGQPVEPCPENLPTEGCTYTLDCASGPRDFTFACTPAHWTWFVEQSPCEHQWEFCTGGEQQVRCDESGEGSLMWGAYFTGFDGPAPCPTETPHHGDPCADYLYGQLSCGYFCDDGTTWTVGYCEYDATTDQADDQTWLFDGACEQ
jgi:hypothetical protein